MTDWKPIDSAPNADTLFLGYSSFSGRMGEAYRVDRDDCEMWYFNGTSASVDIMPSIKPTHWMPLPPPPKE